MPATGDPDRDQDSEASTDGSFEITGDAEVAVADQQVRSRALDGGAYDTDESTNATGTDIQSAKPAYVKRPPVFEYPRYPNKWEGRFYVIAMFAWFFYGFYCVYRASIRYRSDLSSHPKIHDVETKLFGKVRRDDTDYEWAYFRDEYAVFWPALLGHTVLFNGLDFLVSSEIKGIVMLIYTVAVCVYQFQWVTVLVSVVQGILLFLTAVKFKRKIALWILAAPLLGSSVEYAIMRMREPHPHTFLLLVMYNWAKWTSYSCEYIDRNIRDQAKTPIWLHLYRMMQYGFYYPYQTTVIVTYNDYADNMRARTTRPRDYKGTAWYTIRMIFWFWMIDTLPNWFHFGALLKRADLLKYTRLDWLCGIGYTAGAYFHMKYVVMFGMPAMFAKFDNLETYEGPRCISRVAMYSKMWRNFDRGLYAFFKRYIFTPICQPTFSVPRKLFAMSLVFLFVTMWHGFREHIMIWTALNLFAMAQELISKTIYVYTPLKRWRDKYLSDVAFRRLVALIQLYPETTALVAIFYFLGGSASGWHYISRVWVGSILVFKWYSGILLWVISYLYCNACMECEIRDAEKKKQKQQQLQQNGNVENIGDTQPQMNIVSEQEKDKEE